MAGTVYVYSNVVRGSISGWGCNDYVVYAKALKFNECFSVSACECYIRVF